ncbi:MAG TPA: sensor histidine kinase [Terracidiphilus sp.]|jgi:signal transduction histidine kinase|nr:sensor histidine kinase [Terracidiphilus sp.]
MDHFKLTVSEAAEIPPIEGILQALNPELASGETLADVAHEANNMVSALSLYCDLLEQPGVLAAPYQHYGSELKMVAAASRRLVARLMAFESQPARNTASVPDTDTASALWSQPSRRPMTGKYWDQLPPTLINDLAWELQANRNLLAALAGPAIKVTVDAAGGALPVRLNSEDLTRILVNLVKNAVEAMPNGGHIHLGLHEISAGAAGETVLLLNVEDNGLGIALSALENLFEAGFTTRSTAESNQEAEKCIHRGLGLAITRSLIESAGGHIRAANRDPVGACFQIELPLRRA